MKKWRAHNKAVLICLDANKNPQKQGNNRIARFFLKPISSTSTVSGIPANNVPQHTTKDQNQSIYVQVAPNLLTH